MNEVVIVGCGPTGMMLAGELALAGVDVAIVERRPTPELVGSRAGGFHSRTLEILDQRGIADRFLAEGQIAQAVRFGNTTLDLSDFPTRYPHSLGLWQNHIERIMLGWVEELGVPVRRGLEVTGFAQDETGVDLHLAEGDPLRATYLVGADGGRSVVRKAAGIDFVGLGRDAEPPDRGGRGDRGAAAGDPLRRHRDPRTAADGRRADRSGAGDRARARVRRRADARGARRGGAGRVRHGLRDPPSDLDLQVHQRHPAGGRLPRRTGADRRGRGAHPPSLERAGDRPRGAGRGQPRVEARPGGQGHLTRRPPGQLSRGAAPGRGPRVEAHDGAVGRAAGRRTDRGAARRRSPTCWPSTGRASWSRVSSPGSTSPTTSARGTRCSDDACPTSTWSRQTARSGSSRCCTRPGPCCSNLGEPGGLDLTAWADRVRSVDATYDGVWELPVIGEVDAPSAVLIRPDGHVAWVGEADQAGLTDALTRWFGPPA